MTDRELMQQALEALEEISGGYSQNLIVALRDRLAQSEREWVGLTDDEKAELDSEYGDDVLAHLDAIEAKLKEKNT